MSSDRISGGNDGFRRAFIVSPRLSRERVSRRGNGESKSGNISAITILGETGADKREPRRSIEIVRFPAGGRFTRKKGTAVFANAWQYRDERGKGDGIRLRSRRHFLLSSHSPGTQLVIVCFIMKSRSLKVSWIFPLGAGSFVFLSHLP